MHFFISALASAYQMMIGGLSRLTSPYNHQHQKSKGALPTNLAKSFIKVVHGALLMFSVQCGLKLVYNAVFK